MPSKVRAVWETGKLIHQHILLNQDRADYGDQVVKRLSSDIKVSSRELHRMLEFARVYPIVAHAPQLTWSAYRDILSVNDPEKRKNLTSQAARNKAKRYVERVLKRAKSITITTSKSDKYDRYLAGVFYQTGKGEHYLNQELLEKAAP